VGVSTEGQEFVTPVIDILTHGVVHGAYHRGQIARGGGPDVDAGPGAPPDRWEQDRSPEVQSHRRPADR
jgi:hypothetical protein